MKYLIVLTALMLTAISNYGQSTLINNNGDTLVITPLENIKRANHIFIERDYLQAVARQLNIQLENTQKLNEAQANYILNADNTIQYYEEMNQTNDTIKAKQEQIINNQQQVIEDQDQKIKNKTNTNKILGIIALVLLGVVILK